MGEIVGLSLVAGAEFSAAQHQDLINDILDCLDINSRQDPDAVSAHGACHRDMEILALANVAEATDPHGKRIGTDADVRRLSGGTAHQSPLPAGHGLHALQSLLA